MTTKLHIGNMPRTSTNNEIEGLFRPFGRVFSFVFAKDPVTGLNTGCGTIEMDSDMAAQAAIDRLNFTQFGGRTIGVSRVRNDVGKPK